MPYTMRKCSDSRAIIAGCARGKEGRMFAGLLSTKLVFLDAIGSDPTQPRKIPGAGAHCRADSAQRARSRL